jgi:hypothetical protein
MKKSLIFLTFIALFASNCKDKTEQIPAYLKLEGFEIDAPGGANWHKVNLLWLYVGTEFLGAYSPGSEVPILADGLQTLTIFPGINMNGQVITPEIYPFFKKFEKEVTLTAGQTTVVNPKTCYDAAAIIPWGVQSEFDVTTLGFENLDEDNEMNLVFSNDSAFFGRSAVMQVDTAHTRMDVATEWVLGIPTSGGQQVWLEMNYQCDAPLELFLRGRGNPLQGQTFQAIYQFNTTLNWNKIYFNLTPYITQSTQTEYSITFRLNVPVDPATLKYTALKAVARFDNLKIVHF